VEIKIVREQKMRNGNDETAEIVLDDAMYKTACINLPRSWFCRQKIFPKSCIEHNESLPTVYGFN
jgi:hypothetical protein